MAANKGSPRNAFERALDAALAFQTSWWHSVEDAISKDLIEAEISEPQVVLLGDETSALGPRYFDRRVLTIKKKATAKGKAKPIEQWTITRPMPLRFSSLPIELLETLARDILAQSEALWRQANIDNLVAEAQNFDLNEALQTAREILGDDAGEADLLEFANQMRLPAELAEGGDAAAKFFDESISRVSIDVDDDGSVIFPETPQPPGAQPFDAGEWDFYSPEEVAEFEGPETDAAYAFRVVRLCEAIAAYPDAAVQLAMQLGAVTREWEIWRENEEFLRAGRTQFAQQQERARSKREKA
ncbi:MAG: hypothetical protein JHD35_02875 [Sphingopyxis sp.]|nr:hypothetical protein [Sphingopyxis sp.]